MAHLTLQAVSDRLEIADLQYRYALALDTRDWALLERCFTVDAIVDYGELGGVITGAAKIAQFCRSALDGLDASQHLIGNTMVTIDGDRATGLCYFVAQHVFVSDNGSNTYLVAGTYHDELHRGADGWQMTSRAYQLARVMPTWRGPPPGPAVKCQRLLACDNESSAARPGSSGPDELVMASRRWRDRSPTRSGRIDRQVKYHPFSSRSNRSS